MRADLSYRWPVKTAAKGQEPSPPTPESICNAGRFSYLMGQQYGLCRCQIWKLQTG
jgi:hypothetical protein